jgi:hypothetical protein
MSSIVREGSTKAEVMAAVVTMPGLTRREYISLLSEFPASTIGSALTVLHHHGHISRASSRRDNGAAVYRYYALGTAPTEVEEVNVDVDVEVEGPGIVFSPSDAIESLLKKIRALSDVKRGLTAQADQLMEKARLVTLDIALAELDVLVIDRAIKLVDGTARSLTHADLEGPLMAAIGAEHVVVNYDEVARLAMKEVNSAEA